MAAAEYKHVVLGLVKSGRPPPAHPGTEFLSQRAF
jgi:hypothetical protein